MSGQLDTGDGLCLWCNRLTGTSDRENCLFVMFNELLIYLIFSSKTGNIVSNILSCTAGSNKPMTMESIEYILQKVLILTTETLDDFLNPDIDIQTYLNVN